MNRPSDETLSAYADGALDERARAEVDAYLQTDAAARALVEEFRRTSALVAQAFDAPLREAPPQRLIDAIMAPPQDGAGADRVTRLGERRRPRAWSDWRSGVPLAAALALMLGFAAGFLLGRQGGQIPNEFALGPVAADSALHRVLETYPSGRTLEGAGPRLAVVTTFRDRHARACREVEALLPGTAREPTAAGVACRSSGGRWIVEGAIRLAEAPAANSPNFQPSGVAEKEALEGLLTMLGAQQALPPEEEQALLQRGWK